jgi:flagellar protein FliS
METGVVAASPHKLIVMLFDGAIMAVRQAIVQMKAGELEAKGTSISKALAIIGSGLRDSLDKKAGGEIAENLDALYDYMSRQLLAAHQQNKPEMLAEVVQLLQDLRASWEAIGTAATQAAPAPKAPPAYDALAPRANTYMSA